MSVDDLCLRSVGELVRGLQEKRFASIDICEAYLERIRLMDSKLGAFTCVFHDEVRAAAAIADEELSSGHRRGLLHGLPVVLKDNIDVVGKVTTGGSRVWKNNRATKTATLVHRLENRGLIVLGKAHLVELAIGGFGSNKNMGTPWNPWDPKTHRVPGGSSSGCGVAIAARLSPYGIGTDTGGSVRLPAAWCGVVGLKPSHGRIPTHGVRPLCPSFDTVGPMGQTVEDVALLFGEMTSGFPKANSLSPLTGRVPGISGKPLDGVKIGRLSDDELSGTTQEISSAYEQTLAELFNLGAEIVEVKLPHSVSWYGEKNTILMFEGYELYGELEKERGIELGDFARQMIRQAAFVGSSEYLRALGQRQHLQSEFSSVFEDLAAIVTPTTEFPAIAVAEEKTAKNPTKFTRFVSYLNLVSIVLPNGVTENNLPLSIQFVCPPYEEDTAIRLGSCYQAATDWHLKMPMVG